MKDNKICFNRTGGMVGVTVGVFLLLAYLGYSIAHISTSTSSRASFTENAISATSNNSDYNDSKKTNCAQEPSFLRENPDTYLRETVHDLNDHKIFIRTFSKNGAIYYWPMGTDKKVVECRKNGLSSFQKMADHCKGVTFTVFQDILPTNNELELVLSGILGSKGLSIVGLPYCEKGTQVIIPTDSVVGLGVRLPMRLTTSL